MAISLTAALHIRAAATDILLELLDQACESETSKAYFSSLLGAYWATSTEERIIQDFQAIAPALEILQLKAFCNRNYPHYLAYFE